jgi:flagellar hook capping protein FlgD
VGRVGLVALSLALLVGSAAAFTRTEKLKLEPAPVAKPKFERKLYPSCGCRDRRARLSVLFRRPVQVDVSIVDVDGAHVATLARGKNFLAGRRAFRWNGRNDAGEVVARGRYRLQIRLVGDRRTILIPTTIVVRPTASP